MIKLLESMNEATIGVAIIDFLSRLNQEELRHTTIKGYDNSFNCFMNLVHMHTSLKE